LNSLAGGELVVDDMLEIDGSYLEGGGQIVRTSLALSSITGKACKIINIRKGRPAPGLKTQHLQAVKAVATLCEANVVGAELKSTILAFKPRKINIENIRIDIPTAGSVGLVLQALMIPAAHAKKIVNIEINGGATTGKWAVPVNYIKYVLLPILEKIGYQAELEIIKYGYYPKGGAKVKMKVFPVKKFLPVSILEQGKVKALRGISHASQELKVARVAERQARAAKSAMVDILKEIGNGEIKTTYVETNSTGSGIDLWIETKNSVVGANGLGELKKRAEIVGEEAGKKLLKEYKSGAPVDSHMADQIIPYLGLASMEKKCEIRVSEITNHTKTNIWVTEKFLPVRFEINKKKKIIKCKAID